MTRAAEASGPPRRPQRIFLIPGFLGFSQVGDVPYFAHVEHVLADACRRLGMEVEIASVDTHPTGSIWRRTQRLLECLAAALERDDGPVHLVGHSTGGLDARLLLSPGVSLSASVDREAIARRVRSVVMVASPHFGTPVATFFDTVRGRQLLQLVSFSSVHLLRWGRLPVGALARIAALVGRGERRRGQNVVEELYGQLLADFTGDRRRALERFWRDVRVDQRLLRELTRREMRSFNASYRDRPGVRYGSVVVAARYPGWRSLRDVGLDPYAQATHLVFHAFYRMAGRSRRAPQRLDDERAAQLAEAFGVPPAATDNDGVVPTLSQVWGEIVHAVEADHLDVIGHFDDRGHDPPHVDWLTSATRFGRRQFERLWADVARFVGDS